MSTISPQTIFSESTQRDLSNDTLIIHIVCLPSKIYTNTFWIQLDILNCKKINILMQIWEIWMHIISNIAKMMLLTFTNNNMDIRHCSQMIAMYLNTRKMCINGIPISLKSYDLLLRYSTIKLDYKSNKSMYFFEKQFRNFILENKIKLYDLILYVINCIIHENRAMDIFDLLFSWNISYQLCVCKSMTVLNLLAIICF